MRNGLARRVGLLVLVLAVGAATALAGGAANVPTLKIEKNTKLGSLLVSSSGRTLYHLTSEKKGSVVCSGACAKDWPPLLLTGSAAPTVGAGLKASKVGEIKRPDGHLQVTYNGMALYRYSDDGKPGDVKGQGEAGIWYAVTSAGTITKASASGTAPAASSSSSSSGSGYSSSSGGGYSSGTGSDMSGGYSYG